MTKLFNLSQRENVPFNQGCEGRAALGFDYPRNARGKFIYSYGRARIMAPRVTIPTLALPAAKTPAFISVPVLTVMIQ